MNISIFAAITVHSEATGTTTIKNIIATAQRLIARHVGLWYMDIESFISPVTHLK
jgi:hypothetical protein